MAYKKRIADQLLQRKLRGKGAEIFFAMVANQTTYNPERVGIDEKVLLEKRITRYKRELERITGTHIEIGNACVP